uniref:Protein kinase domain-containing protein n=1 Tax=Alexandrium monilatum TaxID=311494 RepID=A0A7S4Q4V9_9DINO
MAWAEGLKRAREDGPPAAGKEACVRGSLTRMPSRLPPSLECRFELVEGSDLGEGSVAVVRRVRDRRDGQPLAMKVMEKHPLVIRNMVKQVHREVRLQKQMRHPNILRLFDFLEDDTHIYMLLELAGCGGLLGLMQRHPHKRMPEPAAGWLYGQITDGVSYLHSKGCIHRDLKPDNILLGDGYCPKVCDFGWCADLGEGHGLRRTTCGTLDYMAPEVLLNEGHGLPVDLWALGILLYELLSGHTPFICMVSRSSEEFVEKVTKVEYPFPPWFSNEACHLVHCLLQRQPAHRWLSQQVLGHPWIARHFGAPKQAGRTPRVEPSPTHSREDLSIGGVQDAPALQLGQPAVAPPCPPSQVLQANTRPAAPQPALVPVTPGSVTESAPALPLAALPPQATASLGPPLSGIAKSLSRPELLGASQPRTFDPGCALPGRTGGHFPGPQGVAPPTTTRQQSPLGDAQGHRRAAPVSGGARPGAAPPGGSQAMQPPAQRAPGPARGMAVPRGTSPPAARGPAPGGAHGVGPPGPGPGPDPGPGPGPGPGPRHGRGTGNAHPAMVGGSMPLGMPYGQLGSPFALHGGSLPSSPATGIAPPGGQPGGTAPGIVPTGPQLGNNAPGSPVRAQALRGPQHGPPGPAPVGIAPPRSPRQMAPPPGPPAMQAPGPQAALGSTALGPVSMAPPPPVSGSFPRPPQGSAAATAAPVLGGPGAPWLRDQTPAALRPTQEPRVGGGRAHGLQVSLPAPAGAKPRPPHSGPGGHGPPPAGAPAPPALVPPPSALGNGTPLPPFPGHAPAAASPRALFGRGSAAASAAGPATAAAPPQPVQPVAAA